jgi:hypothetical protein
LAPGWNAHRSRRRGLHRPAADAIAVSIDAGHVRAIPSYQARSFEILVAQVSNEDQRITFSSVPPEADRQTEQLRRVLYDLGATPCTEFTILSDGAEGPRGLGEAASIGPTFHVLDWFHLSMRIQHVAQIVRGWPKALAQGDQESARIADAVEHIKWRLWHGQVRRALDLMADTLAVLDAAAATSSPVATTVQRAARALRALELYVAGQAALIIDYANARYDGEPISTAVTESTVQWLVHRRMNASQQMRWSPRGAHLMLKVRSSVFNRDFDRDCAEADQCMPRLFRRAA